jgi:hypothetical protein
MIKQMTLRLDQELYDAAKRKCKTKFGIGLTPLIKVFLKSFVTQKGVGFYIGDDDLTELFNHWLRKKKFQVGREGCAPLPFPRLKDLYDL